MNIVEHVSLLPVGTSSGYMPRSGIAWSLGITMSNILRSQQTDFQSVCTSLQTQQQWRSVPLSPHSCQHLLSPKFLMINDVEHFLRCFSAIRYSSVENTLLSSVLHSLMVLFVLDISPLSDIGLVKILPNLLVVFLSYWQCLFSYKTYAISWGPL